MADEQDKRYVRVDIAGNVVEEGFFDSIEGRFHPDIQWLRSDTIKVGQKWDEEAQVFIDPPQPAPAPVVVPASVTRRQGMAMLIKIGMDDAIPAMLQQQVDAAIQSGDAEAIKRAKLARNDFLTSTEFHRNWPLIETVRQTMNWTNEYVDSLFIQARSL